MRILENVVKRVLNDYYIHPMQLKESVLVSDELKYHLDKRIPLSENVFRIYSKSFINLVNEVRSLYKKNIINLNDEDRHLVESDLGKKVILENGQVIYLEVPIQESNFLSEAKYQGRNVQLGKIMQGDVKKFKVYVKNDK